MRERKIEEREGGREKEKKESVRESERERERDNIIINNSHFLWPPKKLCRSVLCC